jgi:hypothetical protein
MPLFQPSFYKQLVPKTSDQEVTASTTLIDDDKLSYAVATNEVWVFEFYLYTTFDTDAQIKVAVNAPATNFFLVTAEAFSNGVVGAVGVTSTANDPISLVNTGATNSLIKVTAVGSFAASGTVVLRWAQNTSDPVATAVKAGSYLRPNLLPN